LNLNDSSLKSFQSAPPAQEGDTINNDSKYTQRHFFVSIHAFQRQYKGTILFSNCQHLFKEVNMLNRSMNFYRANEKAREQAENLAAKFEAAIKHKKGALVRREKFYAALEEYLLQTRSKEYREACLTPGKNHQERLKRWKRRQALDLAAMAGQRFDEHGYGRGDYMHTHYFDFVDRFASVRAPYHDLGGQGLALVSINRTRVYSKKSKWRPSETSTRYFIGRNEAGTYFAHPVPESCRTVIDAVQWIWSGQADKIIARQGDIALIFGRGPKMPTRLPWGHKIEGDKIVHATHPSIPLPSKGQRIIVGRRAAARVSEATRD
jgi:hypothetical protein